MRGFNSFFFCRSRKIALKGVTPTHAAKEVKIFVCDHYEPIKPMMALSVTGTSVLGLR